MSSQYMRIPASTTKRTAPSIIAAIVPREGELLEAEVVLLESVST
jgi:hypothetical protein